MFREYLGRSELYDLIQSVVNDSFVDGIYNQFLVETLFHVRFYLLCSDEVFTEEELSDSFALYDKLVKENKLDKITGHGQYRTTAVSIDQIISANEKRNNSLSHAFKTMQEAVKTMEEDTDKLKQDIQDFDFDKIQEVVNFKKAVDGSK